MQAEVDHKPWSAYVHNNNECRLQSSVTATFPNGRSETVTVGLLNIKHVKAASRKNLPRLMFRVYSRTSAGDLSENGFLANALSERVANKYGLQAGSCHRRIEDIEQSDMRDMPSNHLG